jgi:hypothetical protein
MWALFEMSIWLAWFVERRMAAGMQQPLPD